MSYRLSIPRYVWQLAALTVICVGSTFALWAVHVWTPLQRHYLWPYVWCSRPGADPSSQIALRWIVKTAPGRTPELATANDIVSGTSSELSSTARRAGWTGLTLGPRERAPIATLKPFLEEQFFNENNAWIIVLPPLLCGLAAFCFLLLSAAWLESRLSYLRWQLEQTLWFEPTLYRVRKCLAITAKLFSGLMAMTAHKKLIDAPTKKPIPAPVAPPTASMPATFSPFGTTQDAQKTAYVWSKKDEIE